MYVCREEERSVRRYVCIHMDVFGEEVWVYVRKGEESVGVCEEAWGGVWMYVHMHGGAGEESVRVRTYVWRGRGGECGCTYICMEGQGRRVCVYVRMYGGAGEESVGVRTYAWRGRGGECACTYVHMYGGAGEESVHGCM